MENIQVYLEQFLKLAIAYTPKVLLAIITLLIGLWVVKKVVKVLNKVMDKKDVDQSLQGFLSSLTSIILKLLLILSVISMVGIETTSFVAILAAAGFAIGMALQGSLGNFAGGVLILLFKPYKVGDFIESQGYSGVVQSIQIFNTVMLTPDNKKIIIPNGAVSNGPITNFTAETIRRLDLSFGIGYHDDIDKAKSVIEKIINGDERIKKDLTHLIAVGQLADSSVNITVRVWCDTSEYWNIYFDIHEKIKKEFDANGVSIPFPQTDVHLHKP
ncbi:mechanosensitive ion channel family protein [Bacteroidota bacterium]